MSETYVEAIRRGGNVPVVICRTAETDHQAVKALAPGFRIVARAPDGVVEAIEHTSLPVAGVQFHPEGLVMYANDMFMTRFFRDLPRFIGFCPKE